MTTGVVALVQHLAGWWGRGSAGNTWGGNKQTGWLPESGERWGSLGKVVHVHIQQEGKQVSHHAGVGPGEGGQETSPHLTFGDSSEASVLDKPRTPGLPNQPLCRGASGGVLHKTLGRF